MASDSPSSHREHRFYRGVTATCVANVLQAANFLSDRFLRKSHGASATIDELYRHSMDSAFAAREAFLVTGAPHASAYYPRDFAWFYPDVLDPGTIIDADDAARRIRLIEKSVRLMLGAVRSGIVTTTLIPLRGGHHIGANYFALPSDTLLGVMAGLDQLLGADRRPSPFTAMSDASASGNLLLAEYRDDLRVAVFALVNSLCSFERDGTASLLCDVDGPRSAATDTRAERLRFVTNASVYATFELGIRLGIADQSEIETILGRTLPGYKRELLGLFGRDGYIAHSLDCDTDTPASAIALDFVNVLRGFWDFRSDNERALFSATADLVLAEPRFRIAGTSHFLVSVDNPRKKWIHRIATPSYQGRSAWPTFNVEFADRMLDFDEAEGGDKYRPHAQDILRHIRHATEIHGGYQELLSEQGLQYRTWAYRGAVAHSWFPRFLSVWKRAFGKPLLDFTKQR
ncbi:MAG: hypothetical protein HY242_16815 [Afipia sp.]|nr:hypothetical protein [Afipia sp.]